MPQKADKGAGRRLRRARNIVKKLGDHAWHCTAELAECPCVKCRRYERAFALILAHKLAS